MIRHTVIFTLKHAHGSLMEKAFLRDAKVLTEIPGVKKFEQLKQVSKKNDFQFGFSMEFASQRDYEAYNTHPEHVRFVETRCDIVAIRQVAQGQTAPVLICGG